MVKLHNSLAKLVILPYSTAEAPKAWRSVEASSGLHSQTGSYGPGTQNQLSRAQPWLYNDVTWGADKIHTYWWENIHQWYGLAFSWPIPLELVFLPQYICLPVSCEGRCIRTLPLKVADQLKPTSTLNYKGTPTDICLPLRVTPRIWKLIFLVAMTIFCNVSKNALCYKQATIKPLKIFSSEFISAPDHAMPPLSQYLGILEKNYRCQDPLNIPLILQGSEIRWIASCQGVN